MTCGRNALRHAANLDGRTVTGDALHADKTTARQILGQGGDYLLQVKSNQPTLHKYAKQISKDAPLFFREKERGHGRHVERELRWVGVEASSCDFPGVEVILWERRRQAGKKKWENRYFITSLVPEYSHRYAQTIREHWGIESRLHWRKDAILREDDTRCRDPWTVSNLMLLRNLVIHFYEHTHQEENLPAWVQVNQRSNRHLCRWMMRRSWGK